MCLQGTICMGNDLPTITMIMLVSSLNKSRQERVLVVQSTGHKIDH